MMSSFRVAYADRPEAIYKTKPKDVVAFERASGVSAMGAFSIDAPRLEHLWLLAYYAAKRVEGVSRVDFPAFDDWLDDLEGVDILSEDGDDPTPLDSSPTPGT